MMLRSLILILLAVSILSGARQKITVLHINDTHGHLEPFMFNGTNIGGAARIASLIKAIRATNDAPVLLFHTGDTLSRGDAMTLMSGGGANLAVMEKLGFDAYIPGNGDFYGGAADVLRFSGLTAIPFLGANITLRSNGMRLFPPYIITNVGGVRTALLGLCFIRLEHAGSRELAMQDAVPCAQMLYPELASNDIIIALTHIGFDEDRRLAASVPIRVVIGGHSHTVLSPAFLMPSMSSPSNSTLIAQAGEHYACLGRVDILLETGPPAQIISAAGVLIPVDAGIPEDPEVAATIRSYREKAGELLAVASADIPHARSGDSPAGKLAAAAVMKETAVDAAVIDRRSIAAGFSKGPISYNDVFRMHSGRSAIVICELTGDVLKTIAAGDVYAALPEYIERTSSYAVAMTEHLFIKMANDGIPCRAADRRLDILIADYLRHRRTIE
ncbi:MAG: metallophosphoesterase [Spirochaetota bacterium]